MQDLYETEYEIFNHLDHTIHRPLASVALHPAEEINDDSMLEEIIRQYIKRDILKIYGLNLIDFLELPHDIVNMLFKLANVENTRNDAMISDIQKNLGQSK
jgi:CRISPR/Cas system-associated endonuclease/helicase Cas3